MCRCVRALEREGVEGEGEGEGDAVFSIHCTCMYM